jgi:hypothetical protein
VRKRCFSSPERNERAGPLNRRPRLEADYSAANFLPRWGGAHFPPFYSSVADPGSLSRILIFVHHGSRIQKQQLKRGMKKSSCPTFFVATNITNFKLF